MLNYLNKENQRIEDILINLFKESELNEIKSPNDDRKMFYRGKCAAINDISIKLFNIEITE